MVDNNNKFVVCKNGHQQPVSAARFCIHCGTALTDLSANPNQIPANPQLNGQAQPNQFVQPAQQNWGDNFQQPNNQIQPFQQPPFNAPNYNQNLQQLQPFQPQYVQQQPAQFTPHSDCYACGGNGQKLDPKIIICKECNWLRPLIWGTAKVKEKIPTLV